MLLGHIHRAEGATQDSIAAYEAAVHDFPAACPTPTPALPLTVYLRLGAAYLASGGYEYAADVYALACAARPCAAAWRGAGVAALRCGRLDEAELALAEASVHDTRDAAVWGWLALVHVLGGRHVEAKQVRCVAVLLA